MNFHEVSPQLAQSLRDARLDPAYVSNVVRNTITEDLAGGVDVTSVATVPLAQRSIATFGCRGAGALAGVLIAQAVVEIVCGPDASNFEVLTTDGSRVSPGDVVARVEAPTQLMLTAERTALNLMCHLSGVATATAKWVDAISGTDAIIRDTRKTTPGLRALEKYAVRCGGGENHRMALSDAALVKDNHVAAAGGIVNAFNLVRATSPHIVIEVEVDTLDQLREVIAAGADLVLLDNMSPDTMREAVAIVHAHASQTGHQVLLEASGGLTLDRARSVAETGVHFISVGAITHSAPILDLGLDLQTVLS